MDKKQMQKVGAAQAQKAVKQHEQKVHKMATGGMTTRGNGCATKGTKARGPAA